MIIKIQIDIYLSEGCNSSIKPPPGKKTEKHIDINKVIIMSFQEILSKVSESLITKCV